MLSTCPPPSASGSGQYPSCVILEEVLTELCELKEAAPKVSRTMVWALGQETACAHVHLLPRRVRGEEDGTYIFGKCRDGYIVVRPRGRSCPSWPVVRGGVPAPVRLHRWLADVPAYMLTRHKCDDPSCVARAHLQAGTATDNQLDRQRKRRRIERAPASPSRGASLHRYDDDGSTPTTTLPSCHRVSRVDARFCMAGFISPSKKARLAMRQGYILAQNDRDISPCV